MGSIDLILLGFLGCLIAASLLFRRCVIVRVLAILVLLSTIWLCLFSLFAFTPRLAVDHHRRQGGNWSPEFREGVRTAHEVSSPYLPYIFICSIGLASLALARGFPIPKDPHVNKVATGF